MCSDHEKRKYTSLPLDQCELLQRTGQTSISTRQKSRGRPGAERIALFSTMKDWMERAVRRPRNFARLCTPALQ